MLQDFAGALRINFCISDNLIINYIHINDTSFELSVFWLSDTESRTNKLRLSGSVSIFFKTRLMLVTYFCSDIM